MLQPGDHAMTFGDLRHSILVTGPPERPTGDRAWRAALVDNLEVLARQLRQVGVHEIFLGGSFVEAKDHPADIDGYFLRDRAAYKTRALLRFEGPILDDSSCLR